jgi:hypothetical protein
MSASQRLPLPCRHAAWLAMVAAAGCGGGAGGGSGPDAGIGDLLLGTVRLLAHDPADGAVQVPLSATILLTFDAPIALETLADEDTWLRADGAASPVAGTFATAGANRVRFTPAQPLQPETDYTFQVSALTSDQAGRILDVTASFSFRTFDDRPPVIAAVDVAAGAIGVARTRPFTIAWNEPIAPASVTAATLFLRDQFGQRYDGRRVVNGASATLTPHADLPGDRQFTLVATTGIRDRAGNAMSATASTTFSTARDGVPPSVVGAWPGPGQTGISPLAQPTFQFDESMDPATVEATSLQFVDEFGAIVPFAIASSPDQRTLRLRPSTPLASNRRYTLTFLVGPSAATDVSGNGLAATQVRTFTTGTDATPPQLVRSEPAAGDAGVPGTASLFAQFDEELDAASVGEGTVSLTVGGASWPIVVARPALEAVRATPLLALPPGAPGVLTLRGGPEGLRDLAGNPLPADLTIAFQTSTDGTTPQALVQPADGAVDVATNARVSIVFDAPMQPATLTGGAIAVTDDAGTPIAGTLAVGTADRVAIFTPAGALAPLTYYRVRITGGAAGPRRTTGNWLPGDVAARFRTGALADGTAPTVNATLNGIHASRRNGLVVPPSGFTVDVALGDANGQWPDLGAVEVAFEGAGAGPDAAALFATASISPGNVRVQVPASAPLAVGSWTLVVRARDLAGNSGQAPPLPFTVAAPSHAVLPFERPQVVWLRTDLDRDDNGRPDFDDDLLRLGFATAGDPLGHNARLRRLVLDGIVATASRMFGRGSRGEPIDAGSVALRFTTREPIRAIHMQMALGGLDPEGPRNRGYGAESTGVLGRAWFDARNANPSERNTSRSPGLGVFPGEMWLHQTRTHLQVWPSYVTAFAQKFRPLCPDMGGTPAGAHPLDGVVLAPGFDPAAATSAQRARWQTIMDAADDWATAIGIVLAHEIGHSVGLVAPGPAPGGLFGDSSLHNTYAGATDVMAASVGYEALTTLDYRFRDIDLAYLRQRVLMP